MLVVSYSSHEWADRCNKLEVAQEWIGPTDAHALIQTIADFEALQNAAELIEFLDAKVDDAGCVMIDFSRKHRIVLRPIDGQPVDGDGLSNWSQVRRLQLIEIVEL